MNWWKDPWILVSVVPSDHISSTNFGLSCENVKPFSFFFYSKFHFWEGYSHFCSGHLYVLKSWWLMIHCGHVTWNKSTRKRNDNFFFLKGVSWSRLQCSRTAHMNKHKFVTFTRMVSESVTHASKPQAWLASAEYDLRDYFYLRAYWATSLCLN